MTKDTVTTTIEILGGALIVIGVSMIWLPLAVITAGVGLILLGGLLA